MPGQHKKFRRVDITENVYARVYEDDKHIELVGKNAKLTPKQMGYGKDQGPTWVYGDNWRIDVEVKTTPAPDDETTSFNPDDED